MENYNDLQASGKDPELWEIAKRRASFKYHLATYVIINLFLWAIWFLTSDRNDIRGKYPWPIWSTLGWGVGLFFHFLGAYVLPRDNGAEREYEKLIRKKKN